MSNDEIKEALRKAKAELSKSHQDFNVKMKRFMVLLDALGSNTEKPSPLEGGLKQ